MSEPTQPRQPSRMVAHEDDPVIGVHVLTEFVYCSRSGVVAFEEEGEDTGEEGRPVNLDYVPRYDIRAIDEALQRALNRVWMLLMIVLISSVGLWVIVSDMRRLSVGILTCIPVVVIVMFRAVWKVLQLNFRKWQAVSASQQDPIFSGNDPVPINWWRLRNAGFAAKRFSEPMFDERWKLRGSPWLFLERGSIRIPVFRQHHPTDRPYPQHFARVAAYCHLLEVATDYQSPYGVILFGTGYEGIAIPITPGTRKVFHDALVEARQLVRASRDEMPVPKPKTARWCAACPRGLPRVFVAGRTENTSYGRPLYPHCVKGRDGRFYHSACGDRFEWIPPHERAVAKRLCPAPPEASRQPEVASVPPRR